MLQRTDRLMRNQVIISNQYRSISLHWHQLKSNHRGRRVENTNVPLFLLQQVTFHISSVSIHTVPLTWCFLGSGDISCGMNLIGPLICLLDLLVPSGSVSMAISASSLLAWSHSEHCLRRETRAALDGLYWFCYHRHKSFVFTVKKNRP